MAHGREGTIKGVSARAGWSLRNYVALFMAVLLAVAAIAALAVRGMLEEDARQSAGADTSFASQRVARQIQTAFDQIAALSIPLAANPSLATVFADPSKCGIGYAPISPFTTGHIDLVRLDGSVVCSSSKSTVDIAAPYAGQAWLLAAKPSIASSSWPVDA